ncbi:MAG TPA: heavy metal response regulator transcription factor [Candidatus Acidoferrum sp.]|nr:heavy metal response regulator transcription factor [Candidatus Acidoferrum sp.]
MPNFSSSDNVHDVMRVLVIEDELKTAAYLRQGLTENGFTVEVCASGDDGLHQALSVEINLIILDVMLPGRDGWSVLAALRKAGRQTPVLFLTARDTIHDKVKGLELGADDYLIKPFDFAELLARVRTILRRGPARQAEILQVADLQLDTVRRRATRAGSRLELTAKEFALLELLARRQGEPLSRTIIAEQVWDVNFDSDFNVLEVAIRRLRSKVDDPFTKNLIHTVRGVGYVIEERSE